MFKCKNIKLDNHRLHVELEDGRIISTPLSWYPALLSATDEQRKNYKLIGRRTMVEWAELDLHLDIEEIFRVERKEEAA
ncbi:DUF2442 domain-containing protein [Candidatus Thiosymbion oneisti]|uniref:DUF2442 domain-containing protein n=1 Tax=Candidatus Thiosymbion oneisti TaxID=589554 RepID=UPI00105D2A57|nr:DUF2442 domain-containing protein [Candidatus Thiosymbion oneisti]